MPKTCYYLVFKQTKRDFKEFLAVCHAPHERGARAYCGFNCTARPHCGPNCTIALTLSLIIITTMVVHIAINAVHVFFIS